MTLRDVQLILRPGMIELGWGHPEGGLLPRAALARAAAATLGEAGAPALAYGAETGPGRLIAAICERLAADEGRAPAHEQVVITGGISQGLDHLCTLLARPGDSVLVEAPSYHLAQRILRDRRLELVPAPADADGLIPEAAEAALDALEARGGRAALLYTIPSFNNPAGTVLPLGRRRALAELALRRGLVVVEDEAYREVWYEAPPPPPVASLAEGAPVVRLGSFAKIIGPGLRLGWMVAPPELARRWALSGLLDSGGGVNHFTAMVVAALIAAGDLDAHLPGLRAALRARRDTLLAALAAHLPAGCTVAPVRGGFFAWVELPPGRDAAALLPAAEALGVSYLPGSRFFPAGGGAGRLRLSFSLLAPDELAEGARRLGRALAAG